MKWTGEPMRNFKREPTLNRTKVLCAVVGIVGGFSLGLILVSFLVQPFWPQYVPKIAVYLVMITTAAGAFAAHSLFQRLGLIGTPIPPEVEDAASSFFRPGHRQRAATRDAPEDRIKQPEEPAGPTP